MPKKPTYKELEKKIQELEQAESENKKTVEALRESEQSFRIFFEQGLIGMAVTSVEKFWLDSNDVILDMFGYSRDELINMKWTELTHPDDLEHDLIQFRRLLAGEIDNYSMEKRFIRKDGKIIFTAVSINAIRKADDNSMDCILAFVQDLTDYKQAEEEKIKAQEIAADQKKLAFVGQVAGRIAHDFNNILGVIMGNTELSLLSCKDAEIKKSLGLILEQTIRGKNLTKNLVAFAKDQEPTQEFFNIKEKIDIVLNLLKRDLEGIELIKENKPGMPDLLADPGMIEHAFVNLIQNSIHALSMVEHPRIITRTYCSSDNIYIEIEDNGCGIPKDQIESIYKLSFSLKGIRDVSGSYKSGIKGTGYGMANVKKYIELHKGNISVESEIGSGTKFTISLPVIKKELTIEEKSKVREEMVLFEKYILLVEDEIAISDVQYRVLTQEPCSHKVDAAYNGQDAIALLAKNQYDLVSLDYFLTGNINGMDVYNHIRKTNKSIPILFVSGNIEFLESISELKQKDTNIDYLSKPCQNIDYVNSINMLLKRAFDAQQ